MTARAPWLALLAAALTLGFAPPASAADSGTDIKGKNRVLSLFAKSVAPVGDSVVRIQCDEKDAALGTVVSADGYILTKGSELKGKIICLFRDGSEVEARLVGYHKPTDLALVKAAATKLKPVAFTAKKADTVGNWVAAPGLETEPVAVGVVSVAAHKLYGDQAFVENANRGYLGVRMAPAKEGVLVDEVTKKSAAEKAGIVKGDLIVEIAGKAVSDTESLRDVLQDKKVGETVTVRLKRGDEELTLKAKLAKNAESRSDFQNVLGGAISGRRTGFPSVIQHDTVLRPIDCGGPLVDLDGEVLGLNIARAGRVETWALPASVIEPVLKELLAGKYAVEGK